MSGGVFSTEEAPFFVVLLIDPGSFSSVLSRSFDRGKKVYYNRRGHRKSGENPSR